MKVRVYNLYDGKLVVPGIGELADNAHGVYTVAEADQHLVLSNLEAGRISGKLTYSVVDDIALAVDADVVTALVAADIGKVVQKSGPGPFVEGDTVIAFATGGAPLGVLIAVNGGRGIVRRFGEAPCLPAMNSDVGVVVAKDGGGVGSALMGAGTIDETGTVVGRMIVTNTQGGSRMFVTALITAGLTVPAVVPPGP